MCSWFCLGNDCVVVVAVVVIGGTWRAVIVVVALFVLSVRLLDSLFVVCLSVVL